MSLTCDSTLLILEEIKQNKWILVGRQNSDKPKFWLCFYYFQWTKTYFILQANPRPAQMHQSEILQLYTLHCKSSAEPIDHASFRYVVQGMS